MTIPHVFFADSPSIGSKAIRLLSGGRFSHCGFYDAGSGTVIDSLYSAGGVTEYPFYRLLHFFPKVEIYEFSFLSRLLLARARQELGKPYDYSWLLPFPRSWHDPARWYCSELVAALIIEYSFPLSLSPRQHVSPQALYNVLVPHATRRML
jgi:hypothetical protein